MRDCLRYAPLIGSREGELEPAEATALAEHLEACPRCAAEAATLRLTEGLVSEALLAEAARRDFAPFVDEVMVRIGDARPHRGGVIGWLHHHWKGTIAALAPALAAAAVFMYVHSSAAPQVAQLELSSEGNVSTVLQTSEGPVVLLAPEES